MHVELGLDQYCGCKWSGTKAPGYQNGLLNIWYLKMWMNILPQYINLRILLLWFDPSAFQWYHDSCKWASHPTILICYSTIWSFFFKNLINFVLTHYSLVTPYDVIDLGQHWLRLYHVSWRCQATTGTKVESSVASHAAQFSWECLWCYWRIRVWCFTLNNFITFPGG